MPQDEPSGPDLADANSAEVDLEELEAIHGDLPVDPIPGLDS